MSEDTLRQISTSIEATKEAHGHRFKAIEHIDTTGMKSMDTAVKVATRTLDVLTNFLDEEICVVPASTVSSEIPSKGIVHDSAAVDRFVGVVNCQKKFVRRSTAEGDPNFIQPIPCAVIRWNDQVLLLRRNKKGHALHEKYLLWAGGHVNVSDDSSDILKRHLKGSCRRKFSSKAPIRLVTGQSRCFEPMKMQEHRDTSACCTRSSLPVPMSR